jgi:hypothetical protein
MGESVDCRSYIRRGYGPRPSPIAAISNVADNSLPHSLYA